MATLGDLERSVMDVLWDRDAALSANDLRDALSAQLAATTVLTVLSRLENKGFVTRDRDSRPHLYRAATTRADHMAELMHEVLGTAPDREAVLARFVGQVAPGEAAALRRLLDGK
ncbi:BlaI/MecI/CopY family transcriptional regulator [Microbacterium sp. STN6]|uniref:BlaI/MecI/CopY family transcriptional regulator n=1 Tax=Microbacterium sp. STN6 TaxID=2995588 RepID=UPI002260ECB9|nr:BlaI/MecI/CopY family transcriptional regulator [Microbacterium sp. STN6]MCX7521651.1 BlaI/MecI/CopY family transcriptional regulator [Microbacterium sp. STN6]